jgi:hypothetical protein
MGSQWIKDNQVMIQEKHNVVGDRSHMDTTMVEIIFLISEGRYNRELILREKGVDLKQGLTTR